MPKALIFGINGQDGFYLRKLLETNSIEVTGVSRSEGDWQQGDVGNPDFVERLIKAKSPEYIFHLAANSAVRHDLLFEQHATIVNGALNILESVFQHSPQSRVFIAGSGLQFVNKGKPVSENDEFFAGNAYTLARIQAVYAARFYRTKGIKAYTGYLFHHDSPLRSAQHLNRRIVDTVKKIAAGSPASITIGDITVEKEFGFAGDIVEGIFQFIQQDSFFEACIGTGKAYTIERWLEICFSSIGKRWQDHVQLQKDYIPDFKKLVSDISSMKKINWEAKTGIEELARMMLTA